ncbi:MAG: UDP-glucose 4-epimerase GalE [Rhodobacteraceae bacterium]|nr:UDP-glucose 4-epimerase GalE [Paracoccaceae bacterium]
MRAETVLVTGGAGYIGAHTCLLLACRGYRPVTLDSLVTGRRDFVRYGPLIETDLGDAGALVDIINETRPIAIVHLAASTRVADSTVQPAAYWQNNLGRTLTLMTAAIETGCRHVVFASTSAVYGLQDTPILSETMPPRPTNAYAASKLAGEMLLENLAAAHGMGCMALRYFNVAGADPDGAIGDLGSPGTALIPTILAAASGTGPPLQINGDDYDTADGTCIRDYIHVMDVAAANVRAMEWTRKQKGFAVLNAGSGTGYSIREILAACEAHIGRKIPASLADRRAGDIARTTADCRKARDFIALTCTQSDLQSILRDAWRWHQNRKARI